MLNSFCELLYKFLDYLKRTERTMQHQRKLNLLYTDQYETLQSVSIFSLVTSLKVTKTIEKRMHIVALNILWHKNR